MTIKIKICGIKTLEAYEASKDADFIGFVFHPKSPRFINAEKAKKISEKRYKNQKIVGLFVDTEESVIEYIADLVNLDFLQFHGNEDIKKIYYFKNKLKLPIIKSISISSTLDTQKLKEYIEICDMILFDSIPVNKNLPGGSGKTFNWNYLKNIKINGDWMLAGGLCKENLLEAIKITKAPIIDLSSSLEDIRGEKSPEKIKDFLKFAKSINL